jgi:hypothetical protein
MQNRTAVFLSAGFGGVASNLLKLAVLLTGGPVPLPGVSYAATYSLGLVFMAGLGGATALALKETSPKKAIFIGLGLPAFLQVGAANISQAYAPKPESGMTAVEDTVGRHWGFASTAFADATIPVRRRPVPSPAVTKPVVKTIVIETAGDKKPQSVTFYSKDKKMLQVIPASDFIDNSGTITVPSGASSFSVNYHGIPSQKMQIDETTGPAKVSVEIKQKPWSGLYNAIGINNAKSWDVDVQQQKQ